MLSLVTRVLSAPFLKVLWRKSQSADAELQLRVTTPPVLSILVNHNLLRLRIFVSFFAIAFLVLASLCVAQDWKDVPIPVSAPSGMSWKIQQVSDDFNYDSSGGNRPKEFSDRWNDTYLNTFSGPSCTSYHRDHTWTNDGFLNVHANWDPKSSIIYAGCLSSKEAYTYPLLMETRVKLSTAMLANNVWMISADQTEEIDLLETYPNERENLTWFDKRLHLSHHVFERKPFKDYQPSDDVGVKGTWYHVKGKDSWRGDWLRIAVYWRDPWHLEYFINGDLVRTVDRNSYSWMNEDGKLVEVKTGFNVIDKFGYTKGTGLSKPMHVIINLEQQQWITDKSIFPSREDLTDSNHKNIMYVDWVRVFKGVKALSQSNDSQQAIDK